MILCLRDFDMASYIKENFTFADFWFWYVQYPNPYLTPDRHINCLISDCVHVVVRLKKRLILR